jgi:methyl-accepting chemotaxis protein
VNEVSLEKVSYFSFPMAALFITMFLREFTRLLKMKWVSFVLVLPASFSSLYILLLNTKSEIDLFFNNYLLNFIIIPLMLLSFILLIIAYIKKRLNKYLIILSAFILNILAGIHDIIYTINYQTPYCWLVPYSCLTLLISIFTVLAMEESSIYAESVKRTREVDRKNASMRAVFNKLEDVSRNLINSSTILKDNISKAALIIDESGVNNNVIYEKLNIQIREIENVTNMITERLEKDADKIPKAVISQTGVVEAINNTLNNMNNHIEKIHMLIIQTDNIARELSKIASNSKEIVQKSRVSIEKVSENSKFISEVLENIQEIVEESNFLSVNASIESSYAGVASEGFSILAGEIKNLANKSKEWLNMSQERLKLMTRSITESTKLSEQVADHLLKIIEKAADSADMIAGVSVHINEHKVEASAIREGTDMLLQETLSIRSMTEEDFAENENLKLTLFTLKKSFIDMTAMLSRHNESQNIIREAIGHIQDVLSDNLNTIDILKEALLMAGPEKLLKRIDLI